MSWLSQEDDDDIVHNLIEDLSRLPASFRESDRNPLAVSSPVLQDELDAARRQSETSWESRVRPPGPPLDPIPASPLFSSRATSQDPGPPGGGDGENEESVTGGTVEDTVCRPRLAPCCL